MNTNRTLILVNFFCIYFIWGSTYLVVKTALEGFPPYTLIFFRLLTASLILFTIARLRNDTLPNVLQLKNSLILGFIFFILCNATIVWSQQFLDSGLVAVLLCSQPLFIALLQHSLNKKRVPLLLLLGIASGTTGVIMIQQLNNSENIDPIYLMLVLFASLAGATGAILSTRLSIPTSPWMNSSLQMGFASCIGGCIAFFNGDFYSFSLWEVPKESWYSFLYLVFFGSIVSYTAFNYLVTRVSPSAVATHSFVNPLVALFLGITICGQLYGIETFLPATLLIGAVILMLLSEKRANARTEKKIDSRS